MLIIGEKINTSRRNISEAVKSRNKKFIQEEAVKQIKAGALMLDVNAGMMLDEEPECLEWMVKVIQDVIDIPLSLDSSNPIAIKRALNVHRGQALINSISLEPDRYKSLINLVLENNASVVALCLDEKGFPKSSKERTDIASTLLSRLIKDGVHPNSIYLDPLICPISTDFNVGRIILDTISAMKESFPGVHIILGISNISFGLPARRIINQAFLPIVIALGVDAVIIDPSDRKLMELLLASMAINGQDEYCAKFIEAFRSGVIRKT
jgi:cobalamin-dependent methionine synthase I